MARRRPRSMKVMGQRFAIEWTNHLTADASEVYGHEDQEGELDLLGHCLSDQNVVALNIEQGADRAKETLLHETLHALFNKTRMTKGAGGDVAHNLEEDIVARLGAPLLLWLRENRAIVAYLQEAS